MKIIIKLILILNFYLIFPQNIIVDQSSLNQYDKDNYIHFNSFAYYGKFSGNVGKTPPIPLPTDRINLPNTFPVLGNQFTLEALPTGLSIIKISTSLDCQGVIEKEIFISEDIHYYPNPTDQDVSVHVSGQDTTVQVSVFSEKGDLIYTQRQQIQDFSRKTKIDLSRQITGTYIVVMDGPTVRKTFKIVKK